MKNYYIVKYDDVFVNKNIDLNTFYPKGWELIKLPVKTSIDIQAIKFLMKNKFFPTLSNLFIGPPNVTCQIHIDSEKPSYAFNYVFGGTKSTMRWFKLKSYQQYRPSITTAGTEYIVYRDDQVDLIEELDVPNNTLFLTRIDIPHQVSNLSNYNRYCLSARGIPTLTWDKAVSLFQSILEI